MKRLKRTFLIFLALGLVACGVQHPTLTEREQTIVERIKQIRELRADATEIWPGFSAPQYDAPLLYFTDSVCYAVNPTRDFQVKYKARLAYHDEEIEIYKTLRPDSQYFHMVTDINFDDSNAYNNHVPFLRCSSPEITRHAVSGITNDSTWLPLVLHEYTHGFQLRHIEFAKGFAQMTSRVSESDLKKLYKTHKWMRKAVGEENETLLKALSAESDSLRDTLVSSFLSLRTARKEKMTKELGDSVVEAEAVYELVEGMARYVEANAGFQLGVYKESADWLYRADRSPYFFATGYNLIRLYDKYKGDKSRLVTTPILPLESYFVKPQNDKEE